MGVSKVDFGNETLIDLTNDTVNENNLLEGATAHGADGEPIYGNVIVHNVVDNLSSTSSEDALSANQGRVLNIGKQDKPIEKTYAQFMAMSQQEKLAHDYLIEDWPGMTYGVAVAVMSYARYQALTPAEKQNGTIRFIPDFPEEITWIDDASLALNRTWSANKINSQISTLNSKLTNIGKTCCYSQGNTGELRNAEIPMTVKVYSDDDNMYKPDGNGILITGAGTYLVQAHFHILASANDEVRCFINQSLHTLFDGVSSQIEVIPNYSMQKQITLTKIVRFDDGAERVKMKFETNNGNSYVFPNNLTQNNRITITKIK